MDVFCQGKKDVFKNKSLTLISIYYHKTPYGELIIGSYNDKLCLCDWRFRKMRTAIDKRLTSGLGVDYAEQSDAVIVETINQLEAYFTQKLTTFDLPLLFVGTNFQKKVWNELLNIPYGVTSSYLALSEKLENKNAIRAVASANGANAISIIVPCHRIVGSDGALVGYAGGLSAKQKLLMLENAKFGQSANQITLEF